MTIRVSLRMVCAITGVAAALVQGCSTDTPETLLVSAKAYIEKNDSKAAVIQLKNALQKNPNSPEARFLLGRSLLESGDAQTAEKELRKALELGYPSEQVVPPLARSLAQIGQFKAVADEFGKLELATAEANAELQTAIGDAQVALGNIDAGRRAYAKALSARADYWPARLSSAQLVASTGDLKQALGIVDSVLANSPAHVNALQLRGRILQAQGNSDEALAAYRKAVQAKADLLPSHWAIVSILLRQNNTEEAKKQLNVVKQLSPNHPQTLYLQALIAYRDRDLNAARDAIQQQLRAAPDNLQGLLLAAGVSYDMQSYGQAEAYLLNVLQRVPDHRLARRMLIAGYLRSGQPDKALETLKPALQQTNKDPAMLSLAGEVYMHNGDARTAADYFAKAAALDPSDAKKRAALAVSHMATGQIEKGVQELEQVAASDSGIRADMALIAAHMRGAEYDKALAAIAYLEKKQPKSALPHNLRGSALLAKNDLVGARRSFERALEVEPTYFSATSNLARMDLAENKPEVARQRFDALLAKEPTNLQALLALAQLRAGTGAKPDEVTGILRTAVSAHPANAAARLALIRYYVGAKEPKKAVVAAQEALASIPNRAEVLDGAARAYQAAGDTNQALATYKKLVALQPSSPQPFLQMAQIHVASKNMDGALEDLRKALALKPDLVEAQRAVVAIHLEGGRVQEALATAREVQKQRPKESMGYILEGDVFAVRKNMKEAVNAYRTGLKQVPATDLAIRLHSALSATGSDGDAEQFSVARLRDHPRDDLFRLHLAQVATAKQNFKTAAQHYLKLLDRQPNNALVLNNLAWVKSQLKDPNAADYAEKANKIAPNQPAIMDTLGVLLIGKGENARGLELLQQASALAPQAAGIRLNLARSLIKVGNKEAARKELAELAKLGNKFPDHATAAQLMREL